MQKREYRKFWQCRGVSLYPPFRGRPKQVDSMERKTRGMKKYSPRRHPSSSHFVELRRVPPWWVFFLVVMTQKSSMLLI